MNSAWARVRGAMTLRSPARFSPNGWGRRVQPRGQDARRIGGSGQGRRAARLRVRVDTQMPDARDASLVLAAYASHTQRVKLGTGVLPIYTRHPTAMAQMAASLDELSGGRFILGLGVSHKVTVEGMWGLRLENPVDAMRE